MENRPAGYFIVRRRVGVAVVGDGLDPQRVIAVLLLRAQPHLHVVVAREAKSACRFSRRSSPITTEAATAIT